MGKTVGKGRRGGCGSLQRIASRRRRGKLGLGGVPARAAVTVAAGLAVPFDVLTDGYEVPRRVGEPGSAAAALVDWSGWASDRRRIQA